MEISTKWFKYNKSSKVFCCNVDTIMFQCKDWSPYTHSLIIYNPATGNKRHFKFYKAFSNHYFFYCGELAVKVYYRKKDDNQPRENLFVADKGGIVNNFMEDYIQEIENEQYYYSI